MQERREAMDIDWMTGAEINQAIPRHTPNGSATADGLPQSSGMSQHALEVGLGIILALAVFAYWGGKGGGRA